MTMNKEDVARWLSEYVVAWKSYDREAIAALFSEDVRYRYHPYDEPVQGREAVVESWLGEGDHEAASERDEEGTYEGSYQPVAVDGEVAVATGTSTYVTEPGGPVDQLYHNCFVLRFDDDGRCREFTEWYMKRPGA
jgi:ketosteroid isomerase-like protein